MRKKSRIYILITIKIISISSDHQKIMKSMIFRILGYKKICKTSRFHTPHTVLPPRSQIPSTWPMFIFQQALNIYKSIISMTAQKTRKLCTPALKHTILIQLAPIIIQATSIYHRIVTLAKTIQSSLTTLIQLKKLTPLPPKGPNTGQSNTKM